MNWLLLYEIAYGIVLALVCLRIIYNTDSTPKTLAYLLLALFVPVAGMLIYFLFGTNYRKKRLYSRKLLEDDALAARLQERLARYSLQVLDGHPGALKGHRELAALLLRDGSSPLTGGNRVRVLVNGEQKFPEVLEAVSAARHHIHLEYYIFEEKGIGEALAQLLIRKAAEGVAVRLIYDDFGSHGLGARFRRRLREAGVEAYPFFKVFFFFLANRLNYRNHRKIIVVDGQTAFVGGINVSDRYVNGPDRLPRKYWRDTHLRIDGPGVQYLQYLFFCDWRFCSGAPLAPDERYFPPLPEENGGQVVQIAASGPDSEMPTILFSILQAISLATREILITTPYFIPGEGLVDALRIAALSGIAVKILVPLRSDTRLVNLAARSYYGDLMRAGVEIYQYTRGFVHAKTMVTDGNVAIVGTANMDFRSFDLNFEVNAVVYDGAVAGQLRDIFLADLEHARRIDPQRWQDRSLYRQLAERTARLVSPLL